MESYLRDSRILDNGQATVAPFVRLTIDQLAEVIKKFSQPDIPYYSSEVPPGIYAATQVNLNITTGATQVLGGDPTRWGILWSGISNGAPRFSLNPDVTSSTGFDFLSNNTLTPMIGFGYYYVVSHEWWGIAPVACLGSIITIHKVAELAK